MSWYQTIRRAVVNNKTTPADNTATKLSGWNLFGDADVVVCAVPGASPVGGVNTIPSMFVFVGTGPGVVRVKTPQVTWEPENVLVQTVWVGPEIVPW